MSKILFLRICRTCGQKFKGEAHHHYCSQCCANAHNLCQPEGYREKADRFNARQILRAHQRRQAAARKAWATRRGLTHNKNVPPRKRARQHVN